MSSKKWNTSRVTLLHKGGHKSKKKLKNYRQITLNDTLSADERITEAVEVNGIIGEEQNGFRINRRGKKDMFEVREIIDMCNRKGSKGYLLFLDIEKAYDRADREILCRVLGKCGMYVKIIESIY